jgi:protein SCO1
MRRLLPLAAVAALAAAGCGGTTSPNTPITTDSAAEVVTPAVNAASAGPGTKAFSGGTVSPVKAAPELGLRTWQGRKVTLADYKGKAILVTFLYVDCPDICPLIVDNLVRVKERLGPAGAKMRIVAVSVDPTERTRPAAIKKFLKTHRALDDVDYLVGNPVELEAAWARWGIAARTNKDNPALIEHSGVIWGVDAKGRRATFYPASGFDAADIEGDVRLLLKG